MEGPNDPDEVTEGMIPRAVRQIFETASQLEEHGWQVSNEGIAIPEICLEFNMYNYSSTRGVTECLNYLNILRFNTVID